MPRAQKFVVVKWKGAGWALYRVLKRKHGKPPANDLVEIATTGQGNLEIRGAK